MSSSLRVGIVHTFDSPCRCHETIERALGKLGHEAVLANSEDVPSRARELAALDLVFDQTDRFRGQGLLRPVVRQLLQDAGARVLGSGVLACFLSDDKAATKARFEKADVPTPRWAACTRIEQARGLALRFPRIVKPAHEHMSRGLSLVRDEAEQEAALDRIVGERNPAIVEEFVPGRELAVSVVASSTLPIVEWPLSEPVLGYESKRTGPDPAPAKLEGAVAARIAELALRAFSALGLEDWARFDVRLDPAGQPFFLEANTKPSLETGSPCLVAAKALGLDETRFIERLIEVARERHARSV